MANRTFAYDWDLLLEADLTLPVEVDRSIHVKALFSKAYIDDFDLWANSDNLAINKMADLNLNTMDEAQSSTNLAFSPNKSTSSAASDDINSDEETTDPDTAAMIAMGLPIGFTPTTRSELRYATARKPGKDVNFNKYWAKFSELFVKLVQTSIHSGSEAVFAVLSPAVERGAGLLIKHKTIERFVEIGESFQAQTAFPDLREFVRHQIDFDVRQSNVIAARNNAQSFVAKLHKGRFTSGFHSNIVEGELKRRPNTALEVLDPFSAVKYIKHDLEFDHRDKLVHRPYCLDDPDMPRATDVEPLPSTTIITQEPIEFAFDFDPIRDARLVAKDALKYINDDANFRKYWHQRNRLFTKLSDGILMDEEGWYSVTPERIAHHLADRIVVKPNMIIFDAFTGVGGNAIQFALRGAIVYAVDIDPVKIKCARRNAEIYGVLDRITFIVADCFHFVECFAQNPRYQHGSPVDVVFLSPPWGGPNYLKMDTFPLNACTPDGIKTFQAMLKLTENIAFFLPRNTSSNELAQLSGLTKKKRVEIEHNVLNSKVKALTAYYGNLVSSS